jgi:hypothetical protein
MCSADEVLFQNPHFQEARYHGGIVDENINTHQANQYAQFVQSLNYRDKVAVQAERERQARVQEKYSKIGKEPTRAKRKNTGAPPAFNVIGANVRKNTNFEAEYEEDYNEENFRPQKTFFAEDYLDPSIASIQTSPQDDYEDPTEDEEVFDNESENDYIDSAQYSYDEYEEDYTPPIQKVPIKSQSRPTVQQSKSQVCETNKVSAKKENESTVSDRLSAYWG